MSWIIPALGALTSLFGINSASKAASKAAGSQDAALKQQQEWLQKIWQYYEPELKRKEQMQTMLDPYRQQASNWLSSMSGMKAAPQLNPAPTPVPAPMAPTPASAGKKTPSLGKVPSPYPWEYVPSQDPWGKPHVYGPAPTPIPAPVTGAAAGIGGSPNTTLPWKQPSVIPPSLGVPPVRKPFLPGGISQPAPVLPWKPPVAGTPQPGPSPVYALGSLTGLPASVGKKPLSGTVGKKVPSPVPMPAPMVPAPVASAPVASAPVVSAPGVAWAPTDTEKEQIYVKWGKEGGDRFIAGKAKLMAAIAKRKAAEGKKKVPSPLPIPAPVAAPALTGAVIGLPGIDHIQLPDGTYHNLTPEEKRQRQAEGGPLPALTPGAPGTPAPTTPAPVASTPVASTPAPAPVQSEQQAAIEAAKPTGENAPPWYFQVPEMSKGLQGALTGTPDWQNPFTPQQAGALNSFADVNTSDQYNQRNTAMQQNLARRGLAPVGGTSSADMSGQIGLQNWLQGQQANQRSQIALAGMQRGDQLRGENLGNLVNQMQLEAQQRGEGRTDYSTLLNFLTGQTAAQPDASSLYGGVSGYGSVASGYGNTANMYGNMAGQSAQGFGDLLAMLYGNKSQ